MDNVIIVKDRPALEKRVAFLVSEQTRINKELVDARLELNKRIASDAIVAEASRIGAITYENGILTVDGQAYVIDSERVEKITAYRIADKENPYPVTGSATIGYMPKRTSRHEIINIGGFYQNASIDTCIARLRKLFGMD
jgi:hypothetical protein